MPLPLGIDAQGREVLSYLPGDVANYPLPDWLWEESVLRDAGALLRRVHDASIGFLAAAAESTAPDRAVPDRAAAESTATWQVPPHEPAEVVCHNDVAPTTWSSVTGPWRGSSTSTPRAPGPGSVTSPTSATGSRPLWRMPRARTGVTSSGSSIPRAPRRARRGLRPAVLAPRGPGGDRRAAGRARGVHRRPCRADRTLRLPRPCRDV
ncbi:hypothetical protein NKG05_08930 [Oerskovia sp. M15]